MALFVCSAWKTSVLRSEMFKVLCKPHVCTKSHQTNLSHVQSVNKAKYRECPGRLFDWPLQQEWLQFFQWLPHTTANHIVARRVLLLIVGRFVDWIRRGTLSPSPGQNEKCCHWQLPGINTKYRTIRAMFPFVPCRVFYCRFIFLQNQKSFITPI